MRIHDSLRERNTSTKQPGDIRRATRLVERARIMIKAHEKGHAILRESRERGTAIPNRLDEIVTRGQVFLVLGGFNFLSAGAVDLGQDLASR
jgi:hypothetical protein